MLLSGGVPLLAGCGSPPPPPPPDGSACEVRVLQAMDAGAADESCPRLGCDAERRMALVIGTGRDGTLDGFAPLRAGDPLFVIPGEQGLQHLLLGFRGSGFDGRLPLVQVRVRRARDCVEVGYTRFRLPFRADPTDPSRLALEGVRIVLVDDLDRLEYCSILGEEVDLVIDASTPEGEWAHREMRVRIAGIDPNARPSMRMAWLAACERADGSTSDSSREDASRVDASRGDASLQD